MYSSFWDFYRIFEICAFDSNFYTEAFSGMLIDWVKDREFTDKKLTVEYVTKTVKSTIEGVMLKEKDNIPTPDSKPNCP